MRTPRHLSRRTLVAAGAAGLAATVVSPASAAVRTAGTGASAARFHTVGRVERAADGSVRYSWPGISFEGRFRGTGVGVVLDDADNDYDVQVDGETVATLVTPGRAVSWIDGLADTRHRVRVVKRTESPWAAGRFGGFVAAADGAILPRPRARERQIEFIGDSYTAGYGNMSTTQDCSGNGGVNRNSNADLSFGALTARKLDADVQINAFSGRGMVRNYNGGEPGTDFRTYYDRALLNVEGDVWRKPESWRPRVVVIGLGINDFSTPLHPGSAGVRRPTWWPPTRAPITGSSTSCVPATGAARSWWSPPPASGTRPSSRRPPGGSSRSAAVGGTAGSATGTTTIPASIIWAATGIPR